MSLRAKPDAWRVLVTSEEMVLVTGQAEQAKLLGDRGSRGGPRRPKRTLPGILMLMGHRVSLQFLEMESGIWKGGTQTKRMI